MKHKYPAYYVWVVLHELLGYGTGKMFCQKSDKTYNFDHQNPPVNPLTRRPIETWYLPCQTWTGQFEDLANMVDDCRAELVGVYLMDDEEILALFDFTDLIEITAEDKALGNDRQTMTEKLEAIESVLRRKDHECKYLYEKEQYTYVRSFTQAALDNFTSKTTLAYASAIDLLGLVDLNLALPQKALNCFEQGISIRQNLVGPTDAFIAFALNNLALAYTETADLDKAEALHEQAIQIRLQTAPDRIGNSYSNYAVTLLRMGKPDEAENILMQCPVLKDCTDETFLETDNPRYVGDLVLLARIRRAQGRTDEAMRMASKALTWRQKVHGDRFKTCDSMYDVACFLEDEGQIATALDLLNGIVSIAGTLDMGEGQAA